MSLCKIQQEFSVCIAQLIFYAQKNGMGFTFGDAYRDPRRFGKWGEKKSYSSANSVHKVRLAVDLNLFINNKYITSWCEEYEKLGKYWESLHELAVWGGRFRIGDLNHFSFKYRGSR